MKKTWKITEILLLIALIGTVTVFAGEPQQTSAEDGSDVEEAAIASPAQQITLRVPFNSPLFNDFPIAIVNDEKITLKDIKTTLAASHEEMTGESREAKKVDFSNILDRLISIRLIVQETKQMGMNDLPEIKDPVDAFSRSALKTVLLEELGRDITADEGEVEELYKEYIREWKIKSVMFRQEDDAKRMEGEIKAGKSFDEAAVKALDEKLAEGNTEGGYVKPRDMLPEIAEVVSKMEVGAVSSPLKIAQKGGETGYAILKLDEVRYPDEPAEKDRARGVVLNNKRVEAVKDFRRDYIKKHMKINRKLIDKLDFESEKPGIEALSKDKRVIVEIEGEKPLTVGDLTNALKEKYFHGLQTAIKSKNVNIRKDDLLNEMLDKILIRKEVFKRGLEKTEKYMDMLKTYEESLLFGFFVQKVLKPDIKVSGEEIRAYYDDSRQEFTYPEMIKLDSLVFGDLHDAESALNKLQQGADLKWMKENAEGQIAKDTKGILSFDGNLLMITTLPEDLQKALSGVHSGDFRLYKSAEEKHFYVLSIQEFIPSRIRTIEEVQGTIFKNIFTKKLNQSVKEWTDKLRESADIKIYLANSEGEIQK